jgi:hypothetical protein
LFADVFVSLRQFCLKVFGFSTVDQARFQHATCNGPPQRERVVAAGGA